MFFEYRGKSHRYQGVCGVEKDQSPETFSGIGEESVDNHQMVPLL